MKPNVTLFWFRRDLRLEDNRGLFEALKSGYPVLPIFIFDTNILQGLDSSDRRVTFIYRCISSIHDNLRKINSGILCFHNTPQEAFEMLLKQYDVQGVYTNHDYEPYALQRDEQITNLLATNQIPFHSFKDQVIFEKNDILKDNGEPYTVYTPYSKKWKLHFRSEMVEPFPISLEENKFYSHDRSIMTITELGFKMVPCPDIHFEPNLQLISEYHATRDIPSIQGTSHAGIHLRFGTISIRLLTKLALQSNEKYLNELIWREFYQQILFHFPHVVHHSFRKEYDRIAWRNDTKEFDCWCEGKTGYPIVDAGMRELNTTGWMHNRVRMIVASFLTKHLLIDWRWGEAYFAKHLLDYDLASNNGGWQWAAGSGVDAAPYFRIFNPTLQTQKFDPQLNYIRHWIPELDSLQYPQPIVVHEFARKRCLEHYQTALKQN